MPEPTLSLSELIRQGGRTFSPNVQKPLDSSRLSAAEIGGTLPTSTTSAGGSRLGQIGEFLTTPLIKPGRSSWDVYMARNPQLAATLDPNKPNAMKQLMDEVDNIAIGMTTPLAIGTIGAAAALPRKLGRLAGVGFGIPMIKHGIDGFEEGNYPKGIINLTLGLAAVSPGVISGAKKLQGAAREGFGPRGLAEEGGFLNTDAMFPDWKYAGNALKKYWDNVEPLQRPGERIRRTKARKTPFQKHSNSRHYLNDGTGEFPVGPQSTKDYMRMIKEYGSDAEIQEAARFYSELRPVFEKYVGIDDASTRLAAWSLTQLNEAPRRGVTNMLIAERQLAGLHEPKQAGLNAPAVKAALKEQVPKAGIRAKLSDFLDAAFGKTTRSIMGDDPKYGGPTPIDVHMLRLAGFLDKTYLKFLEKRFGKKATKGLKQDNKTGVPSEAQYELITKQLNEAVPEANRLKIGGKSDWTPDQMQAALWAAMRKKFGYAYESPELMMRHNVSTIPTELAFGNKSPYSKIFPDLHKLDYKANESITNEVLTNIMNVLGPKIGIRVLGGFMKPGAWGGKVNPSKSVEVFGTPESVHEFINAVGYYAQQDYMMGYRIRARVGPAVRDVMGPAKSRAGVTRVVKGKQQLATGMDIILPEKLNNRGAFTKFHKRLIELDPSLEGASSVQVGGRPAIRLIETSPKDPAWSSARFKEIEATVGKIADEFKLKDEIYTDWFGTELQTAANTWKNKRYQSGESYIKRLDKAGRSKDIRELDSTLKPKIEQWIREGFERYAPEEWAKFQGKGGRSSGSGGAPAALAPAAAVKIKPSTLGTVTKDPAKLTRGWLTEDGTAINVTSHEASLAKALKIPEKQAFDNYPSLAQERGLVRVLTRKSPQETVIVELFGNPTDAQLRSLFALEKAYQNPIRFYFSNVTTQLARGFGRGVNSIRRKLKEIEADEAANPPDTSGGSQSTRQYAPNPKSKL